MVLNKAHVEPEAKPNQRKPAPDGFMVDYTKDTICAYVFPYAAGC